MKSLSAEQADTAAVPELLAATELAMPQQANALARARAVAEPFSAGAPVLVFTGRRPWRTSWFSVGTRILQTSVE